MSALAAGAAMFATLALGAIACTGLRRDADRPTIMQLAAGLCAAVLVTFALAGRHLAWPGIVALACASVCAATDVRLGFIFDRVLLASLAAIVAATWNVARLADGGVAALACAGALAIPFALSRGRAMGLGDVKFAGTTALALGLHASLDALWLACVSGGGVAVLSLAAGRARPGTRMPFGAFLAMGTCVALFANGAR